MCMTERLPIWQHDCFRKYMLRLLKRINLIAILEEYNELRTEKTYLRLESDRMLSMPHYTKCTPTLGNRLMLKTRSYQSRFLNAFTVALA